MVQALDKATLPIQPHELLVDGMLYDLTNFKHPGGGIIKFLQGQSADAKEAFTEFHMHSKKARKMLASLPHRPMPVDKSADPKETARLAKLSQDFSALRKKFEREGMFKPSYPHIAYRISELVVMFTVGIYLALYTQFWLVGLVITGLAQGRCGWAMHEAGHHSFTGNIWLDTRLQEFIYGIGCGMSSSFWRNQHNKHHAAPQKMKHDVDLETLPLVAFNKAIAKQAKDPFTKTWIKFQALTFMPVTCSLVAAFWQFFLHPRFIIRAKKYSEVPWLVVRYALMYYIWQLSGLSFAQFVGVFFLQQFFGASYIFTTFAFSHSHLPVLEKNQHVHWTEYSSKYTVDVCPHPITDWYMGYLNYQIEHHLFPEMPQYRFTKLYPEIKKFFEENNQPYQVMGFWQAVGVTFRNLYEVGN